MGNDMRGIEVLQLAVRIASNEVTGLRNGCPIMCDKEFSLCMKEKECGPCEYVSCWDKYFRNKAASILNGS